MKYLITKIFLPHYNARIFAQNYVFRQISKLVTGRIGTMERESPEFIAPSPVKNGPISESETAKWK